MKKATMKPKKKSKKLEPKKEKNLPAALKEYKRAVWVEVDGKRFNARYLLKKIERLNKVIKELNAEISDLEYNAKHTLR